MELKIPPLWRNYIGIVKHHCGPGAQAVIAGGSLRDRYFGKPIKDIDIFFQCDSVFGTRQIINAIDDFYNPDKNDPEQINLFDGPIVQDRIEDGSGVIFKKRGLFSQRTIQAGDNLLNLIGVSGEHFRDDKSLVEVFDFGLCKLAYGWDKKLYVSPDFIKDAEDKMFRVRDREGVDLQRSARRYNRFKERYPDFGFEVV